MKQKYKLLVCKDGFSMSVQADERAYCSPRNDIGPYDSVEVGYPSRQEQLLMPWCEDPGSPCDTVYGYVPSLVIWEVINKHGGHASGEIPPMFAGASSAR